MFSEKYQFENISCIIPDCSFKIFFTMFLQYRLRCFYHRKLNQTSDEVQNTETRKKHLKLCSSCLSLAANGSCDQSLVSISNAVYQTLIQCHLSYVQFDVLICKSVEKCFAFLPIVRLFLNFVFMTKVDTISVLNSDCKLNCYYTVI